MNEDKDSRNIDSLVQSLLTPEVAKMYYQLDSYDERKAALDERFNPIVAAEHGRRRFHNIVHGEMSAAQKEIAKLEARAHALRIRINDLKLYYGQRSAPWKAEAEAKRLAAEKEKKSAHRRKNLGKARAVRQANRLEEAINSGDVAKIVSTGQSRSADAATQERATVVAAAQMFAAAGMITQATFRKAINQKWSSEKLTAAVADPNQ